MVANQSSNENVQNDHFAEIRGRVVSPRLAARAIGVSESTVKRWCDRGLIPAVKTAGGHRRMRVADVIAVAATEGYDLAEPQLLQLPEEAGKHRGSIAQARTAFRQALLETREQAAGRILTDLLLAGHSVTAICEDVIAEAFHEIGEQWDCGDIDVYQERRSCEICLRLLHQFDGAIAAPPQDSPLAIGATLSGDVYSLPVTMIGLVLKSLAWDAQPLGSNLPTDTLIRAATELRPRLFWLSVSHIADQTQLIEGVNQLLSVLHRNDGRLIVGGRALTDQLSKRISAHCIADHFRGLEMFARSLHPIDSEPTPPAIG